jgi:oxygen-independent coproporphyrinogen-3 oxidase
MFNPFGIYVHTPWCRTRCPYCAFNVFLDNTADYERWTDRVKQAWMHEAEHFPGRAHSVYFGGGTPSLAPPEAIRSLINALPHETDAEITLETNPGTIETDRLIAMAESGVNRLSIGVQTFNPRHARRLGRGHTIDQANRLLKTADTLGFQTWSMDLMFGLPDQTEDELTADLEQLIAAGPPHVSLYGLTIEAGTPFAEARNQGSLSTPSTELWRRMYDRIVDTLEQHGWERYEVSNFARPGHRSVHNEAVWRGGHYAGLGPGAHGYRPDGSRTIGEMSLTEWLNAPRASVDTPSPHESAMDRILSTLRHMDGLNLAALRRDYGFTISEQVLNSLTKTGSATLADEQLRLTRNAFPLADGVVRRLIEGLQPTTDSGECT